MGRPAPAVEGPFDPRDIGSAVHDIREAAATAKGVADVKAVTGSTAATAGDVQQTSASVASAADRIDQTVAGFSPTLLVVMWLASNALTTLGTMLVAEGVRALAAKLPSSRAAPPAVWVPEN